MQATKKVVIILSVGLFAGLLACNEVIVRDPGLAVVEPFASLFPDAWGMTEFSLGESIYWEARDGRGHTLGYWFETENWGYRSPIASLMAVTSDGVVLGQTVLTHDETPFFWMLIPQEWLDDFAGIAIAQLDVAREDFGPYDIDGVSGATISTEAVMENFWDALRLFQDLMSDSISNS